MSRSIDRGDVSAVHPQIGAVDEVGQGARLKCDGMGDLFHASDPPHRGGNDFLDGPALDLRPFVGASALLLRDSPQHPLRRRRIGPGDTVLMVTPVPANSRARLTVELTSAAFAAA
jgi:hypothetical protein